MMNNEGIPFNYQTVILVTGLIAIAFGFSICLHGFTIRRVGARMRPLTNTILTGVMAGMSGALASVIQQDAGQISGAVLGVMVGGAVGGIVSALIDSLKEFITTLAPRRLTLFGALCLIGGTIVDLVQLCLLRGAPQFR